MSQVAKEVYPSIKSRYAPLAETRHALPDLEHTLILSGALGVCFDSASDGIKVCSSCSNEAYSDSALRYASRADLGHTSTDSD